MGCDHDEIVSATSVVKGGTASVCRPAGTRVVASVRPVAGSIHIAQPGLAGLTTTRAPVTCAEWLAPSTR